MNENRVVDSSLCVQGSSIPSTFRSCLAVSCGAVRSSMRGAAICAGVMFAILFLCPGGAIAEHASKKSEVPKQILRCGVSCNASSLSDNSRQIADLMKLTPILDNIQRLRSQVSRAQDLSIENLDRKVTLYSCIQEAEQLIVQTDLSVDYVLSEIAAEQGINGEVLTSYEQTANKKVQRANWASYYSNAALWSVCEGFDIPTWKHPKFSIPSGTTGIVAGVVPSLLSVYAMKVAGGGHHKGEKEPNMLAQILGLSPDKETEMPDIVWSFLDCVPSDDKSGKTRRQQLLERWKSDKNISSFTDESSRSDLEVLAGTRETRRGVTVDVLQSRQNMLAQLSGEIWKMKRFLYDLALELRGDKKGERSSETAGLREGNSSAWKGER